MESTIVGKNLFVAYNNKASLINIKKVYKSIKLKKETILTKKGHVQEDQKDIFLFSWLIVKILTKHTQLNRIFWSIWKTYHLISFINLSGRSLTNLDGNEERSLFRNPPVTAITIR